MPIKIRVVLPAMAVAAALVAATAFAQTGVESPEAIIRTLVKAMFSNDVATYEKITVPDPRRGRLVQGGRVNEEAKKELEEYPEAVQVKLTSPFRFKGEEIKPDAKGQYPVGTTVRYEAAYRSPMIVSLVRRPEGWRIDLRWWLAMMEMQTGPGPQKGTPDYAIRALTASLVSLDRKSAALFATPNANMDLLFTGAPRQREPSGVYEALVGEMPLVEIGPGEFSELPSGRIVEGVQREDMKVLVGLYGPIEVPFVVRRVGAEWRVEPEPYLTVLMR